MREWGQPLTEEQKKRIREQEEEDRQEKGLAAEFVDRLRGFPFKKAERILNRALMYVQRESVLPEKVK